MGMRVSLGRRPLQDSVEEIGQVVREIFFGYRPARTGLDLDEACPGADLLDGRRGGPVPARVDVDRDALLGEALRDLADVDVHPSRISSAGLVQGRGVQAENGDARMLFGRRVRIGVHGTLQPDACHGHSMIGDRWMCKRERPAPRAGLSRGVSRPG